MRYVIWGAGDRGRRVFPHVGANYVEAFIDMDEHKIGTQYCNKKVISFEEYKEKYIDCYIIIACSHENEVEEILRKNKIYHYFLLSECPGEFQELYPREIIKRYITGYVKENKKYVIYGCTLYSMIMLGWIEQTLGIHVDIIPHKEASEPFIRQLTTQMPNHDFYTLETILEKDIDEILVAVERDMDIVKRYKNGNIKITNVYDCSDRIGEYYNPQIEKFKNIHKGERCFIVATGPSLRMEDLDLLAEKKEISFSVNRIWYAFDKTNWKPDYYVVLDYRFLQEDEEIMEKLPLPYKFVADTYGPYWEKCHDKSIIKFHDQHEYLPNRIPKFSADFSRKSYMGGTVIYACIQLAVYMGFTNIYLLGTDATKIRKGDSAPSHFCKEYLSPNASASFKGYDNESELAYESAKLYTQKHGIHIYNASRGGELEVFPRVDFDELFKS